MERATKWLILSTVIILLLVGWIYLLVAQNRLATTETTAIPVLIVRKLARHLQIVLDAVAGTVKQVSNDFAVVTCANTNLGGS